MKKKLYLVRLIGCDDETEFYLHMTDEEHLFARRLSAMTEDVSDYLCMPTVMISDEVNPDSADPDFRTFE